MGARLTQARPATVVPPKPANEGRLAVAFAHHERRGPLAAHADDAAVLRGPRIKCLNPCAKLTHTVQAKSTIYASIFLGNSSLSEIVLDRFAASGGEAEPDARAWRACSPVSRTCRAACAAAGNRPRTGLRCAS